MENLSPVVVWTVVGLILVVLELFTTTFVLVFFGIAALITAILPLAGHHHLVAELLVFSLLAILGIFLFRSKVVAGFQSKQELTLDHERLVILTEDVGAAGTATLFYQGAPWTVVNESSQDLKKGQKVRITKTEGVKLFVVGV